MEAGEPPTPPSGSQKLKSEEVRRATFPQALRGYDRDSVHDLLDRVADWMEGKAGSMASATPGMREELAKVGERTAGILTAAEDAASKLRSEAQDYADGLRADADDESRKSRLNASQRMDEMIAEAETKAQSIIDEAVARRRQLNQAITSLLERRDEIADEAARLADELTHAVGELRTPDPREEAEPKPESGGAMVDAEGPSDVLVAEPGPEEARSSEPKQTVILEPDSEETELHEPDSRELEPDSDTFGTRDEIQGPSRLLVDPEEDETPPRGVPR